jgi:hypothetical protein
LRLQYAKRDLEAREAEDRITSLNTKLDSLVSFLEEERFQKLKIE